MATDSAPTTEDQSENDINTRLYPQRWGMLIVFGLCSLCNSLIYATLPAVSTIVADYYQSSIFVINLLSFVFFAAYIIVFFPVAWVLDHKGLKVGITIGNVIQTLGAFIRWIPSYSPQYGMIGILLGQTIASIGQVFIVGATVKLSSVWFGPKERILSTGIGYVFNTAGIAIAYIVVPWVIQEGKDIPNVLLSIAVTTAISSILFAVFFKQKPPSPPSISASMPRLDYKQSVKILVREKYYVLLWFSVGIVLGAYFAFVALIEQIGYAAGYTAIDAGIFGFITLIAGIGGDLTAGIADKYQHRYKFILCTLSIATAISFVGFTLAINTPNIPIVVGIASSFMGFFVNFLAQIGCQAAIEISFPISEGISSIIQGLGSELFGMLFIIFMSAIENPGDYSMTIAVWLGTGSVCIVAVAMLFYNGKHKRMMIDMQIDDESGPLNRYSQEENLLQGENN